MTRPDDRDSLWPHRESSARSETPEQLIEAGTVLFSRHGFRNVTVREICLGAGTNVAAVNYHFGGKQGLYTAVVERGIDLMRERWQSAGEAVADAPPKAQLREFVRCYLAQIFDSGQDSWVHKIMIHEMLAPTPALDLIFSHVLQPRLQDVCRIVSRLTRLPASDPRVFRSAQSIQGQCFVYFRNTLGLPSMPRPSADEVEHIAEHVTRFSLAGIARTCS